MSKPEPTPDCCEPWGEIAPYLDWMAFEDWPELLTLAHIDTTPGNAGGKVRVNYCPSCGAERRSVIRRIEL